MAKNYYCLVAGLPDILLGDKKVLFSSIALREMLYEELTERDFSLVQALYLPFDHYNLVNLLYQQQKAFDPRGNYTDLELEALTDKKQLEALEGDHFPAYLVDFAKQILFAEESIEKVSADVILFKMYSDYLKSLSNTFLNEFLEFEINQKNIFTSLTGRKYEMEYEKELIGDGDVVEALVKSRSRDFGLANELEYMESLIQIYEDENILERELKIDRLKWNYLDESTVFNYFTVERVLAFVYKLLIVERWTALNEEEGKKMFQKLLTELQSSYEFPEEYKLSHGKKK
ncbi:DUF2764 family protein [Saccharicrinis fermentans]|uniref:V-type ATP synthase subunit C n=1 Tax=Saccharicrinis fermentans DSM 9555 = JCM 21142 TaxID=869213 RepID=W7Y1C8_9BACT|nr:DUF2764 family protein [Saccharicrinis fermentans]GAF04715.1 hypothetical protein JCM21142_93432 [Saccharicrinis fermentans DSM 9555 = JCM 21142]